MVNKELTEERDKLSKDIDTIMASNRQSLTKVENELAKLEKDRTQLEREKADLEKEKRDSVATMNATQKNATDYRTELEKRRAEIDQARQDRDKHFQRVVELTDQLNQDANEAEAAPGPALRFDRGFRQGERALDILNIKDWRGQAGRTRGRPMSTAACWPCEAAG